MSAMSGVYEIRNTENGNRYVGSSVDIPNRWRTHRKRLSDGIHHTPHLQSAWLKYGEEAFKFSVLLYCEKHELIRYEQFFLNTLRPEYNYAQFAGNRLGTKQPEEAKEKIRIANTGRKFSAESIEKMRRAQRGHPVSAEHRAKISAANTGRKYPPEICKKMGDSHIGNKSRLGQTLSAETRAKIGAAQLGRKRSLETRAKMSAAMKGKKHKSHIVSAETRAKISVANKGKKRNGKNPEDVGSVTQLPITINET